MNRCSTRCESRARQIGRASRDSKLLFAGCCDQRWSSSVGDKQKKPEPDFSNAIVGGLSERQRHISLLALCRRHGTIRDCSRYGNEDKRNQIPPAPRSPNGSCSYRNGAFTMRPGRNDLLTVLRVPAPDCTPNRHPPEDRPSTSCILEVSVVPAKPPYNPRSLMAVWGFLGAAHAATCTGICIGTRKLLARRYA